MAPKIAVIGSDGQLGTDLMLACQQDGRRVVGLKREDIEISEADSVDAALSVAGADVLINTAACQGATVYTTADQGVFFDVNTLGVWNLARWCRQNDCLLVHYSTDYVFGGDDAQRRPYTEGDPPCPLNAYGVSKLGGEYFVRVFCRRHYVIRVASLYGKAGCLAKGRSNFVKMVMDKADRQEWLTIVNDQYMSPTWTACVAAKTLELIDSGAEPGLYHMAGSGSCTWYDLACEIVRLMGANVEVRSTSTPQEGPDAIFLRPRYTALDNAKLRQAGLEDLIGWREALEQFIRKEQNQ